jgi:hypothetical protein
VEKASKINATNTIMRILKYPSGEWPRGFSWLFEGIRTQGDIPLFEVPRGHKEEEGSTSVREEYPTPTLA